MSIKHAQEVLRVEAEGILGLVEKVGPSFEAALEMILSSPGRVIVTGIGKSGLIGRKIVATMNSTGTQAVFLHPVEALHGDLGMVNQGDVVLALSNSGETEELNTILPAIKKLGAKVLALSGCPTSTLARLSDVVIDVGVPREACPLGLAPTASTTASLAMGDALCVCLLTRRGFKESDFQARHPGGRLGEQLRVRVREVMKTGADLPLARLDSSMSRVIEEMDLKDLGTVLVIDGQRRLMGIITDGDLRRALKNGLNVRDLTCADLMTASPKTVDANALALDALNIMEKFQITALPIVDQQGKVQGLVHLHDLLGRGQFSFRPNGGEQVPE